MPHKWRRLKMSLLNPCCDLMALTIIYSFKRMSYCRILISHPFEPSEWVLVRLKFTFRLRERLPMSVIFCVRRSHERFKFCFPGGCAIWSRSSDLLNVCSLLKKFSVGYNGCGIILVLG